MEPHLVKFGLIFVLEFHPTRASCPEYIWVTAVKFVAQVNATRARIFDLQTSGLGWGVARHNYLAVALAVQIPYLR